MIFTTPEKTLMKIAGSEGQSAISVIITSDKGTIFHEDTTIESTICTCTVYEGVQEITPKSYNWQLIENDTGSWSSIGTERSVTIPIEENVIRKRLKCDVEIDK